MHSHFLDDEYFTDKYIYICMYVREVFSSRTVHKLNKLIAVPGSKKPKK